MSGTINVGFFVDGGAIIGIDSKAMTVDRLESRKPFDKLHLFPKNKRLIGTLSGTVPNNQTMYKMLDEKVNEDTMPAIVATWADSYIRENNLEHISHLFVGISQEKLEIYRVRYSEAMQRIEDYGTVGSGRIAANVVLSERYKKGMNREEGFELAFDAMLNASLADFHSGSWLTAVFISPKRRDVIAETRRGSVLDIYHERFAYQLSLFTNETALLVLVHQTRIGAESMIEFSRKYGSVITAHCLGCDDMVRHGFEYHVHRVSFVGRGAYLAHAEIKRQWEDDKTGVVCDFEFGDQPILCMIYPNQAKPMMICMETRNNLGIIMNHEPAVWCGQDFTKEDENA